MEIDNEIKKALLEKDKEKLNCLRLIKAAFLEYTTAKNAKPLDSAAEIQILKKMVSQREDSVSQYKAAGRNELAESEQKEIDIIKTYLPEEVPEEVILSAAEEIITDRDIHLMGGYIKTLKEKFPGASGKVISDLVRRIIVG